ncbi:hypothetical protein [Marivirga arenosa]|uniref:Uncharacterized protein n=1 Tax=Marivirga arenosa TaxID=3059076 RepID=A0AA49GCD8_9BACT|nr:hypothetical protein [Marivirga sp. BKB1-2]WKK81593.2 hypothetical protein QYS47_04745 [Marivirga sp. BKB1-2]
MIQSVNQFEMGKSEILFVQTISKLITLPSSLLSAEEKDKFLGKITQFKINGTNFESAKYYEEDRYLLITGNHIDFVLIGLKDYIAKHHHFYDYMNKKGKIGVIYDYSSPPPFQFNRTSEESYDSIINALISIKTDDY